MGLGGGMPVPVGIGLVGGMPVPVGTGLVGGTSVPVGTIGVGSSPGQKVAVIVIVLVSVIGTVRVFEPEVTTELVTGQSVVVKVVVRVTLASGSALAAALCAGAEARPWITPAKAGPVKASNATVPLTISKDDQCTNTKGGFRMGLRIRRKEKQNFWV